MIVSNCPACLHMQVFKYFLYFPIKEWKKDRSVALALTGCPDSANTGVKGAGSKTTIMLKYLTNTFMWLSAFKCSTSSSLSGQIANSRLGASHESRMNLEASNRTTSTTGGTLAPAKGSLRMVHARFPSFRVSVPESVQYNVKI